MYEVVQKLEGILVFILRELGTNKKTKTLLRYLLERVNELVPVDPVEESHPSVNVLPCILVGHSRVDSYVDFSGTHAVWQSRN